MWHTPFFCCKIHVVLQDQKKTNFLMFVIHLNRQALKTLFLLILLIKMTFSMKIVCIHFFSSTCWQNMSLYGQISLPKQ